MAHVIRLAFALLCCALLTCKAQKQETPKPVPGHTVGAVFDRPVGVYDLRDYGATQADIGPAVLKAALAIQLAGAGIMELPALTGGARWTWATAAQLTWQTIGNNTVPGYVELRSAEGATVVYEEGQFGFPALYSIDGTNSLVFVVRNITFLGDPAHADDVPRAMQFNGGAVLLDGIAMHGVQGRDGTGIIQATLSGKLTLQNSRLFGNGRVVNTGGIVSISGGGLDLINDEFGDNITINGVAYNKSGSNISDIYINSLTLPAQILNSRLATQSASTANVWVHCLSNCNKLSISDSFIEIPDTPFGTTSPPAILVDGPIQGAVALSGGLDLVHNTFSDVGGHRDTQEPHVVMTSSGAAQTRILSNYATSTLVGSAFYDPQLWPAKGFKFLGGSGPVYVEEGATDTQGHILHPYLLGESPLLSQNYNGVTTLYPCHGAVACYDAAEGITIGTGEQYTGSGATYAAVTAGHHLYFSATPLGVIPVPFTGSENSQGTFLSAIQAQINDNGIAAATNGGQIQLTAGLMYGASSGIILNVSPYVTDADVLASLGYTAGANFNINARVTNIGDNSGTGNALTGNVGLLNPDATANSKSTFQFRTTDQLSAAISSLAQPFRIAISAKQVTAGTVYAFDGASANQCSISGVAAETSIKLNCGTSVSWPVTSTTAWHSYVFDVNGASSTVAVDSDTPFYAQNAGTNSLTGVTLGQIGAGGSSAGWDIGEVVVTADMTAQTRHNLMAYLGRNRSIPLSFSPEVVCPTGQAPASTGTTNGSCTSVGGVSSVTGAGITSCTPTTGAVTCTTNSQVPGCSQYQVIEHDNASGFQCGPAPGPSGNLFVSNGTSWVSGGLPLTAGQGATGVSNPTAHDVPIAEGSSAFTFISPSTSGFVLTSNGTGADPSFQFPSATPSNIISAVNHGSTANVPTSYGTVFATLSLTVASGFTDTIDCHAAVSWTIAASGAHTLQWGISQNSTAAPSSTMVMTTPVGSISETISGAMVESYSGTSAGTYTYRILAQDTTASGTSQVTGHLTCIQH